MASLGDRIEHFFQTGMWRTDTRTLSRWEAILRNQARFWFMIGQRFRADRCFLRASSLAYATAFAIVPVLVVVFWLFGGVESFRGYAPLLAERIVENITIGVPPEGTPTGGHGQALEIPEEEVAQLKGMKDNIRRILETLARDVVGSTALNSVSIALIILITVSLLSTVEGSFNDIWGIRRGRSFFYKSNLYLGTVVMLLMLAVLSFGLEESLFTRKLQSLPVVGDAIPLVASQVFRLLAFTLLFIFMPYTKVSWHAGLAGGIFTSLLVQVVAWAGILFNTRVVTWRTVYGPLAGVPVILFGFYIVWIVILLGAEVTYATQNLRTYVQERRVGDLDHATKEALALRIVLSIAEAFSKGAPPLTGKEISNQFDIPPTVVNELTHRLVLGGILVETVDLEGKLVPRQDLRSMRVAEVTKVLRKGGDSHVSAEVREVDSVLDELISQAESRIDGAYEDVTFGDLLDFRERSAGVRHGSEKELDDQGSNV